MSATTPAIQPGTYNVDASHSHVGFEVKHMGIATVRGSFNDFESTLVADESGVSVSGAVKVDSVDTANGPRDEHLRSSEFFDLAQFPQITFRSTGLEATGGDVVLHGEITIKDVTKPITLKGEVSESGQDPWGNERVGFELAAKIDRREFGLTWNQTLANHGVLVSNDVKLVISASAVKAA